MTPLVNIQAMAGEWKDDARILRVEKMTGREFMDLKFVASLNRLYSHCRVKSVKLKADGIRYLVPVL